MDSRPLVAGLLALLAASLPTQEARVELVNGTVLHGQLTTIVDDTLVLSSAHFGRVELELDVVARFTWTAGGERAGTAVEEGGVEIGRKPPRRCSRDDAALFAVAGPGGYLDWLKLADGSWFAGRVIEESPEKVRFETTFGELVVPDTEVDQLVVRIDEWGPRELAPEERTKLMAELKGDDARTRMTALNLLVLSEDPDALAELRAVLATPAGEVELIARPAAGVVEPRREVTVARSLRNASAHGFWYAEPVAGIRLGWVVESEQTPLHPAPMPFVVHARSTRPGTMIGMGGGGGGGAHFAGGGRGGRQRLHRDPATITNPMSRYHWIEPGQLVSLGAAPVTGCSDRSAGILVQQFTVEVEKRGNERTTFGRIWGLPASPPLEAHRWVGKAHAAFSLPCHAADLPERRQTAFVDTLSAAAVSATQLQVELASQYDPLSQEALAQRSDASEGLWLCPHRTHERGLSSLRPPCDEAFDPTPRQLALRPELYPAGRRWYLLRQQGAHSILTFGKFEWKERSDTDGVQAARVSIMAGDILHFDRRGERAYLHTRLDLAEPLPTGEYELRVITRMSAGAASGPVPPPTTTAMTPWQSFAVP